MKSEIVASIAACVLCCANTFAFAEDLQSCMLAPGGSVTTWNKLIPNYYRLNRLADSPEGKPVFEALLNLQFVDPTNVKQASPQAALMEQRFDSCWQAVGSVTGPNGETLTIRRTGSGDTPLQPMAIQVFSDLNRENALQWATNSACSVLIHETFHLLGLVDLYHEGDLSIKGGKVITGTAAATGGNLAYNCRALGPDTSEMKNLNVGDAAMPGYDELTCTCDGGPTYRACANALKGISQTVQACPAATNQTKAFFISTGDLALRDQTLGEYLDSMKIPSVTSELVKGYHESAWDYSQIAEVAGTPDKLLLPAEFRKIAYPACAQANATYDACAANAYVSSADAGGCKPMPEICTNSDSSLWLQ